MQTPARKPQNWMWGLRVGVMAGVFLAGMLVMPSLRHWWQAAGPKQTVTAFAEALKTGDRAAALKLLDPDRARQFAADKTAWEPSKRMVFKIDSVELGGGSARVVATLSELGFFAQPEFLLARTDDGRWLITEIGNIAVDPRWEEEMNRKKRLEDDVLARELETALKGVPGVVVEREPALRRR